MSDVKQAPRQKLDLTDRVVEQVTGSYRKDAQEATVWLAAFMRERCNGQIFEVMARAHKAGFKKDYSYFHRILTGAYFRPDPKTGKPLGNIENFIEIIDALKTQERLEALAGRVGFIETENFSAIADFIDKKRSPARVNKFGAIVGKTGTQKSACFKEYRIRNNHGKVVHIEAPEKPLLSLFLADLAAAYGEPIKTSIQTKRRRIDEVVNEYKCIIVDNVQRLYDADQGGNQTIFSYLQKLQDRTGCTVILSYTPDFTSTLESGLSAGYFEQFIGRMGGLRKQLVLPDYATKVDILKIAAAYKLVDAAKHYNYLEAISRERGLIRILFDDLQEAAALAKADGSPLTIDYLRMARNEEEK